MVTRNMVLPVLVMYVPDYLFNHFISFVLFDRVSYFINLLDEVVIPGNRDVIVHDGERSNGQIFSSYRVFVYRYLCDVAMVCYIKI